MAKTNLHIAIILGLFSVFLVTVTFGETLYVDSRNGSDTNTGTQDKPLQTIAAAVRIVNDSNEPGPATIKLGPSVHNLTEQIVLESNRPLTKQNRLTIEALVLPDDPDWAPKLMPVIISTAPASKSETENYKYSAEKYTIGFDVKTSHVTIRGIKFLGNPAPHTWHYPVWRTGKDLADLMVTQCLFVGDKHTIPYLSPICAMGHEIVADHCIFYNCHTPLIFWDAEGGLSKGCAARYCIIDGAFIAAIWTTQTAEDFDFHHNIITRSQYVWMRGRKNQKQYTLRDCVITDNTYLSGYGDAYKLYGQTGNEITYKEQNVIKTGKVILEEGDMNTFETGQSLGKDWPQNYLHPTPDSAGYELGAGLFTTNTDDLDQTADFLEPVDITEELSVKLIRKGVWLVIHKFPFGANSLVVEMKDQSLVLVDTPWTPEATKTLLDWFENYHGKRKMIAINTGCHWDNLGGNEYLIKQGIDVYGSDLTAELVQKNASLAHALTIRSLENSGRERYAKVLKNLNLTAPNHLFPLNEGFELDFDGEILHVYYPGPTHTQDNVVVYFPDRKLLFGGCMVSGFGRIGNIAEADMKAWPESLRKLKQFDFDRVVPGHGGRMYPELIEENIEMLKQANDQMTNN